VDDRAFPFFLLLLPAQAADDPLPYPRVPGDEAAEDDEDDGEYGDDDDKNLGLTGCSARTGSDCWVLEYIEFAVAAVQTAVSNSIANAGRFPLRGVVADGE
jgi:hypothetical protein